MNIDFQRKIDRVLGSLICRILSLIHLKGRRQMKGVSPERILVILLSEMGSLVLARPMFEHIFGKYPESEVYALLFDQNKEALEILDVIPPENILTVRNVSFSGFLVDSLGVLINLRKKKIDTVVDCELFSRVSSIFSFLSGAGTRAGFHPHRQEGLYRGDFINRPVVYNPYNHISHQFISLVEAIDSEGEPRVKRTVVNGNYQVPALKISQEEKDHLWRRFIEDFPQTVEKRLVLIYPGGGLLPIRAWPLQNFSHLAAVLIDKGYAVGVIGLEDDKGLYHAISSHCRSESCIDLTGYTKTIRELMTIFHFASLLITNDGGPGHFASMTPVPSIIFYGPETPILYKTLDSKAFHFHFPLSCSPCLTAYNHRNSPCDGDNQCLKKISTEEVLAKVFEILGKQENF